MKKQPKNYIGAAVQYFDGSDFYPATIYMHNPDTDEAILIVSMRGDINPIDTDFEGTKAKPVPHEKYAAEGKPFWRVPGTVAPEIEEKKEDTE